MGSETVAAVIPHLELDLQQMPQTTTQFIEGLATFLADQSNPNSLLL